MNINGGLIMTAEIYRFETSVFSAFCALRSFSNNYRKCISDYDYDKARIYHHKYNAYLWALHDFNVISLEQYIMLTDIGVFGEEDTEERLTAFFKEIFPSVDF